MLERDASPPLSFDAVLFDPDGVVTRTSRVHAAAWKELFDELLRAWTARGGRPFHPFDAEADDLAYVDGRPRHKGSCRRVREIALGDGDVASEVSKLVTHERVSAVVVGWQGRLGDGALDRRSI